MEPDLDLPGIRARDAELPPIFFEGVPKPIGEQSIRDRRALLQLVDTLIAERDQLKAAHEFCHLDSPWDPTGAKAGLLMRGNEVLTAERDAANAIAADLRAEVSELWPLKNRVAELKADLAALVDEHAPLWLARLEKARELSVDDWIENGLHAVAYILRSYHEGHAEQKQEVRTIRAQRQVFEDQLNDALVTLRTVEAQLAQRTAALRNLGFTRPDGSQCCDARCTHTSQSVEIGDGIEERVRIWHHSPQCEKARRALADD